MNNTYTLGENFQYSVGIHWELLVEFSYDLYKTFYDIRLLSMLLTVLVSSCHNNKYAS